MKEREEQKINNNNSNLFYHKVISQQINPGIKYEYMLPLGVVNNLVPRTNPAAPSAPIGFGQNDGIASAANVPGRYQLDSVAPNPPRSLGSEGGLFQTIQQGSGSLAGIPLSLPSSSGNSGSLSPSNYPLSGVASGTYPPPPPSSSGVVSGTYLSSLSSSGSLANLGIVPSKFENPPPETESVAASGIDAFSTGTVAPVLPKETRSTPQPHGISIIRDLIGYFSPRSQMFTTHHIKM